MDRLTRKELKTDKFVTDFGRTVEFLEEHLTSAIITAVVVAVLVAVIAGAYYYRKQQHAGREQALHMALRTYEAQVGHGSSPFIVTFPTAAAKEAAIQKVFHALIKKYPGSDEAIIAHYYLGIDASSNGDNEQAAKQFKLVMESGKQPYASQAAFSLAMIYAGESKTKEAEKILRDLVAHPTILVSKGQATIALAKVLAKTNPEEARKLLEPLRTARSAVSRAALTTLGQISQQ